MEMTFLHDSTAFGKLEKKDQEQFLSYMKNKLEYSSGDSPTLAIEEILNFTKHVKTLTPVIFLEIIAEIVLLTNDIDHIIKIQCDAAVQLRSLFIQCFYGAAPEAIRDKSIACLLVLFSRHEYFDLMWTVEIDHKSSECKESHLGFAQFLISMIAGEFHVVTEEYCHYICQPLEGIPLSTQDKIRMNRCRFILSCCCQLLEYFLDMLVGEPNADQDSDSELENESDDSDDFLDKYDKEFFEVNETPTPHSNSKRRKPTLSTVKDGIWSDLPFKGLEIVQRSINAIGKDILDMLRLFTEHRVVFPSIRDFCAIKVLIMLFFTLAREDLDIRDLFLDHFGIFCHYSEIYQSLLVTSEPFSTTAIDPSQLVQLYLGTNVPALVTTKSSSSQHELSTSCHSIFSFAFSPTSTARTHSFSTDSHEISASSIPASPSPIDPDHTLEQLSRMDLVESFIMEDFPNAIADILPSQLTLLQEIMEEDVEKQLKYRLLTQSNPFLISKLLFLAQIFTQQSKISCFDSIEQLLSLGATLLHEGGDIDEHCRISSLVSCIMNIQTIHSHLERTHDILELCRQIYEALMYIRALRDE